MLREVNCGRTSLGSYHSLISPELMDEIRRLAAPVAGLRICHVSGTAFGGGVAEILLSIVPLMNDVGLVAKWKVMSGRDEFLGVSRTMHNGLQGRDALLSDADREIYARHNAQNSAGLDDCDIVIVHDPQPLGIRANVANPGRSRWIWRCHIDMSTPNPAYLDLLGPLIAAYDMTVFHMARYVPPGEVPEPVILPPAIDPLAPKNMSLSSEDAAYIVGRFGLDVERPLLVQVSRFDPWKDPIGVIDAYRMVKERYPEVQLALVGATAADDPAGGDYFHQTLDHAAADPDIYILANLHNVGAVEVNAFQTHADVVIQKSLREGFGLTVTEALWKARPTVAGDVGGIPLQILDGETGYLVSSPEQCAQRILDILDDPTQAEAMARRGRQHVRRDFLTPRLLRDWLELFGRLTR